jgi:hypothetical protein
MNTPDTTLEIHTLGSFSITVNGKPVAKEWPNETVKTLFCSLISPLDLNFTWDRISRSMLGVPATLISRRRVEKLILWPLNSYLIKELGFNPLVADDEGIRFDQQGVYLDALEFYSTVLEGLRLLSLADHAAALEKFSMAGTLYAGSYLPGMPGKIIENTRNDLESLYRTAVLDGIQYSQTTKHFPARIH